MLRLPARAALAAYVKRDERGVLLTKVERELCSVSRPRLEQRLRESPLTPPLHLHLAPCMYCIGLPPTRPPPRAPRRRCSRPPLLTAAAQVDAVGEAVSERELYDWHEAKALPTAVLKKLDGLHKLKAKRLEGQRKAAASNTRIAEAFKNQDRLRENIRSMEKVGSNKLTDRYLKDLGSPPRHRGRREPASLLAR